MTIPHRPVPRKPLAATLFGAALLAMASLGGCSDSGSGDASPSADAQTEVETTGGSGGESGDTDDASDDAETSSNRTKPPSGGHLIDEQWPSEVWVPEHLTLTGKNVNFVGDEYLGEAFGVVQVTVDDMRSEIIAANGDPTDERERPDGSIVLEYEGHMEGHVFSYTIAGEDAVDTGLIIGVGPS